MSDVDESHKSALTSMNENVAFSQLWQSLSMEQQKYVAERLHTTTDSDAAVAIGVAPDTMRHWKNKRDLDRAVSMLLANVRDNALDILATGLVDALLVKLKGLKSTHPQIQQDVATEIIDRLLGKPVQRVAPTNPQGTQEYGHDTDERVVARIAQIMEAARVRKEAQAQALPAPTITVVEQDKGTTEGIEQDEDW